MAEKIEVSYQIYTVNSSGGQPTTQTLVLNKPASVRFLVLASSPGTGFALINNVYQLNSFVDTNSGTSFSPSELLLENNDNEIDVTQYTITTNCVVKVICKYYVKN